ncbi:M4 family metallopeptidase [Myxococcus stipitatus]|uniref:M4 family metallopeptidase n=1 Tax=Myxococcus stipitatus TaxID=83455 RepID=UPI001F363D18|nr:M4 family metallopeptidase [Myxococcus stipitatus]MCE9672879.1 M4 family metallopeptidase [Myxococcus stipitatus]
MTFPYVKAILVTCLGASLTACGSLAEEAPPAAVPSVAEDVGAAAPAAPFRPHVTPRSDGHYFVRRELGRVPRVFSEKSRATGEDVRGVLDEVASALRIRGEDLVFRKQTVDEQGHRHLRFQQFHWGLPVIGSALVLHVDPRGVVYAVNGNARGGILVSTQGLIPPETAIEAAVRGSSAESATAVGPAEQVFLRPEGDEKMHLAWQVQVEGQRADMPSNDLVYVDANDGGLLAVHPRIHSALNRRVYNGNRTTTLPGTLARGEGQAAHADPVVNTNYGHLGTVYDCYKQLFGRDSIDDAGAMLVSTVHHRVNYVNAFWNGTQMVYGDGDGVNASNLANSLDVTAHELTHAVTDYTSGLIYSGESGGLNESMSDIFGAVCEWYGDGKVVSDSTWLIGDDVWTPSIPNDALRYMANPKQDGESLDCYYDYSSNVDVHYSSGISNLAFHLLSQGGRHPHRRTPTVVAGIGIEKAARIFYKANTDILIPGSSFAAAKVATEQAATELGYDAATVTSVSNAWKAVCVGAEPPPETPPNPIPDVESVPLTLAMAFTDATPRDDEVMPEEGFLPALPILVDGHVYTAAQIRDLDIFITHYLSDASTAQLNVVRGFRTTADLQAYLAITNQYPSEQPNELRQAFCNWHSEFFEHDNFQGARFTLAPGWAHSRLGGFWNDRISSIRSSWCASWTIYWEHINFSGARNWVIGGNEVASLRTGGWYTGFWPFRRWHSWNDRISSVGVFW